jgi:mono/diheme cytochrome c family protein
MKTIARLIVVTLASTLFSMPEAPRPSTSRALASPPTEGADVAALFARSCAKCHGKDGRAKTFRGKLSGARDLTNAEWQARVSDDTLAASITNGRGSMPSFKKKLSADQIRSLVAYVRQFSQK